MTAYYGARVIAAQMLRGYAQAFARFDRVVQQDDPEAPFFALFESLNWAVAVDDLVREVWRPAGERLDFTWRRVAGGETLQDLLNGVRYVRNIVHHHWADALERIYDLEPSTPHRRLTWTWRDAATLPHPPTQLRPAVVEQRSAYDRRLAGHRADETLAELAHAFESLSRLLTNARSNETLW